MRKLFLTFLAVALIISVFDSFYYVDAKEIGHQDSFIKSYEDKMKRETYLQYQLNEAYKARDEKKVKELENKLLKIHTEIENFKKNQRSNEDLKMNFYNNITNSKNEKTLLPDKRASSNNPEKYPNTAYYHTKNGVAFDEKFKNAFEKLESPETINGRIIYTINNKESELSFTFNNTPGYNGKQLYSFMDGKLKELISRRKVQNIKHIKIYELSYGFNDEKSLNKTESIGMDNLFKNQKDIIFKKFNKKDREEGLKKFYNSSKRKDSNQESTIRTENNVLSNENPSYNTGKCNPFDEKPKCGDGQDRGKATKNRMYTVGQRFAWYPTTVSGQTVKLSDNHRRVSMNFKWRQSELTNLNLDNNEAIEVEALFYNYGLSDEKPVPGDGKAWMQELPFFVDSNLPKFFIDTRFGDETTSVSYAVGTAHTKELVAGTNYFFEAEAATDAPGKFVPDTGLWQMNFQRGYWFDSLNPAYRAQRGEGDEWYVFSEEFESSVQVKKFDIYNSVLYAPNTTKTAYFSPEYEWAIDNARTAVKLPPIKVGEKKTTPLLDRKFVPDKEYNLSLEDTDLGGSQYYEFEVTPAMVGKDYTFNPSSKGGGVDVTFEIVGSKFMPLLVRKGTSINQGWRYVYNFPTAGEYYLRVKNNGALPYNSVPTYRSDSVSIQILPGKQP
ncbi:hypothetical protein PMEGAS67_55190 [Priestia megaterium]